MDHAARGAVALSDGNFLTAAAAYTQALIEHPSSPDYFIQRSIALTRFKAPHQLQHELALSDAEYAVLLGQKRARREKIQAAQQRRVVALFSIKQYANAAFVLKTMERWRSTEKKDKMEGDMWKAKIEQKLNDLAEDDPAREVTVEEYPHRDLPTEAAMKKMLQTQLNTDGTFRVLATSDEPVTPSSQTIIIGGEASSPSQDAPVNGIKVQQETMVSSVPMEPPQSNPDVSGVAPSTIRHEWFQNAQNVTITIYAKGVPKEQTDIEIEEASLSLSFPHPSNPISTFTFNLDPLFAPIDAAASKSSVLSTKVELVLRKKVPGQKWNALEASRSLNGSSTIRAEDSKTKTASTPPFATSALENPSDSAQSYPTSSRSGPKNWDKLADDLTAKKPKQKDKKGKAKATAATENGHPSTEDPSNSGEDDDADDDNDDADSDFGGDPVDGFFKKLYAGADPDTRRAMMKSYQESGGTALSTDWSDVGKRKVVPVESKKD